MREVRRAIVRAVGLRSSGPADEETTKSKPKFRTRARYQPIGNKEDLFPAGTSFDAALERIRFLFDEFQTVAVSTSSGKDSTVVYEPTQCPGGRGRLPQAILVLDQEAEWTATIDNIRREHFRYIVPMQASDATA